MISQSRIVASILAVATAGLAVAIAGLLGVSNAQATYLIHDFEDGTFGPFNVDGGVTGFVIDQPGVPDNKVARIFDPDGGFQVAMSIGTGDTLAMLPQLHANNFFEWDVTRAEYTGDFSNNFLVFQSNDPIEFAVLDGSAQFMANSEDTQTYSHNYGAGQGRAILDMLDPNQNGDIFAQGFTFFNIFVIQQVGEDESSTFDYDNFRLRVPEPASAMLLALMGGTLLTVGRVRRKQ